MGKGRTKTVQSKPKLGGKGLNKLDFASFRGNPGGDVEPVI